MQKVTTYLILTITFTGIIFFLFMHHQGEGRISSIAHNEKENKIIEVPRTDDNEQEPKESEKVEKNLEEIEQQPEQNTLTSIPSIVSYFENNNVTITAIGDSLTQGVGDETKQGGYIGILERMINRNETLVDFYIYGKRGNRSNQLLNRVQEEQEIQQSIQQSDIVLVTIGANDIMQVAKENMMNMTLHDFIVARQNFEKNLHELIHLMKSINPTVKVYFIGFYNPFAIYFQDIEELKIIVQEWNNSIEELARTTPNTEFIPTEDLFVEENVHLLSDDHFHPNYQGYYRISLRILEYIASEES